MNAVEQAVAVVEEVIDATERKECAYYDGKLLEKARDETFPVEIRQYLNVIAQVATYHFPEENTHEQMPTRIACPKFATSDRTRSSTNEHLLPLRESTNALQVV